jgi:hypothetical protein
VPPAAKGALTRRGAPVLVTPSVNELASSAVKNASVPVVPASVARGAPVFA